MQKQKKLTPARTLVISSTRTPANGRVSVDGAAVANPRQAAAIDPLADNGDSLSLLTRCLSVRYAFILCLGLANICTTLQQKRNNEQEWFTDIRRTGDGLKPASLAISEAGGGNAEEPLARRLAMPKLPHTKRTPLPTSRFDKPQQLLFIVRIHDKIPLVINYRHHVHRLG